MLLQGSLFFGIAQTGRSWWRQPPRERRTPHHLRVLGLCVQALCQNSILEMLPHFPTGAEPANSSLVQSTLLPVFWITVINAALSPQPENCELTSGMWNWFPVKLLTSVRALHDTSAEGMLCFGWSHWHFSFPLCKSILYIASFEALCFWPGHSAPSTECLLFTLTMPI